MSTIIKASHAASPNSSPGVQHIAFNFDDMSSQANRYLDQVRGQAAKILQEAQAQAAVIRQQAEAQGRQAALKAVESVMDEKLDKQLRTLLPALTQTAQEIAQSKQAWLTHWQQSAVQVATAIAARVIRREVAAEPQITLALVKEALEMAAGSGQITIHMHPADVQALGGQVESIAQSLRSVGAAGLVADPQISAGGCRVETRFGSIDQQFEAQLKRIEEELA